MNAHSAAVHRRVAEWMPGRVIVQRAHHPDLPDRYATTLREAYRRRTGDPDGPTGSSLADGITEDDDRSAPGLLPAI